MLDHHNPISRLKSAYTTITNTPIKKGTVFGVSAALATYATSFILPADTQQQTAEYLKVISPIVGSVVANYHFNKLPRSDVAKDITKIITTSLAAGLSFKLAYDSDVFIGFGEFVEKNKLIYIRDNPFLSAFYASLPLKWFTDKTTEFMQDVYQQYKPKTQSSTQPPLSI